MKNWKGRNCVIVVVVDFKAVFEAAEKREVELDINLLWHLHHEPNTYTHTHTGRSNATPQFTHIWGCVSALCTVCECAFSVFTLYLSSVCVFPCLYMWQLCAHTDTHLSLCVCVLMTALICLNATQHPTCTHTHTKYRHIHWFFLYLSVCSTAFILHIVHALCASMFFSNFI